MNSTEIIKKGQWIETLEGISQVLVAQDIFVEEFDRQSSETLNLGDLKNTIVTYQILCDFSGKPRKRNRVNACNSTLCSELSQENEKLLQNIKESNTRIIEAHDKYTYKGKIGSWCAAWLPVDKKCSESTLNTLNEINRTIHKPFTYKEYCQKLGPENLYFPDPKDLESDYFIVVEFFNESYKVVDKKRLFNDVRCRISARIA